MDAVTKYDTWIHTGDGSMAFVTNEYGAIVVQPTYFPANYIGSSISDIRRSDPFYHEYGDVNSLGVTTDQASMSQVMVALGMYPHPMGIVNPLGPNFAGPGFVVTSYWDQRMVLMQDWANILEKLRRG